MCSQALLRTRLLDIVWGKQDQVKDRTSINNVSVFWSAVKLDTMSCNDNDRLEPFIENTNIHSQLKVRLPEKVSSIACNATDACKCLHAFSSLENPMQNIAMG